MHRQSDINDFMMNTTGVLIGRCLLICKIDRHSSRF
ncbi:MAG TPA: hypothetical protein IAA20_06695 [Candidatus Enterococcus avicola]|uniref:Uncharacterized protein n=1 Tax=Candidatus Enterococcus avicola TaxID=2838561 RepID=A0A9D2JIF8_9ENTE|nr:hypothetical protein [Candidatus Enterococcus avicola]